MKTDLSNTAELNRPTLLEHIGAAVAGAIAGAVIGPETSAIFELGIGGLAAIGAPLGGVGGVLVGVAARNLLKPSTPQVERTEHRVPWATISAAVLLLSGAVLASAVWESARRAAREWDGGINQALFLPVAIIVVTLIALAVGVLRRQASARWAAVVISVCAGAAAVSRLLAELSPLARGPGWIVPTTPEWRLSVLQAALFVAIPTAVTALLLSPAARRDFRASRSARP